jgi:hypothetical protein
MKTIKGEFDLVLTERAQRFVAERGGHLDTDYLLDVMGDIEKAAEADVEQVFICGEHRWMKLCASYDVTRSTVTYDLRHPLSM